MTWVLNRFHRIIVQWITIRIDKSQSSRESFYHHEAQSDHLPVCSIAFCTDHLMLQSSQEYARVDETGTRGSGGKSELRGQREEISHK